MFLKYFNFLANPEVNVLVNSVPIKRKACIQPCPTGHLTGGSVSSLHLNFLKTSSRFGSLEFGSFIRSKQSQQVNWGTFWFSQPSSHFGCLLSRCFSTNLDEIHDKKKDFSVLFKMVPSAIFYCYLFRNDILSK